MKKTLIFFMALALLASGCSTQTLTSVPTIETIQSTKVVPPASTATSLVIVPLVSKQCVSVASSNPTVATQGGIVLSNNSNFSLLVKRGNELRIPEAPGENNHVLKTFVSLDNKYLGYEQDDPDGNVYWVIRQADSSIVKKLNEYDLDNNIGHIYDWYSIQWVADDSILIRMDDFKTSVKLFLVDVNVGSGRELQTDFPQIASGKEVNWGIDDQAIKTNITNGVNVIYSPTLTRVVYPKTGGVATLYDLQQKREIASMPLQNAYNPAWSPDGELFSIKARAASSDGNMGDELFVVPLNGPQFRRLTYLGNLYPSVSIGEYNWSPDSKKIALWIKPKDAKDYSLAVLDVNSGTITDYCLTGIASYNSELFTGDQSGPVVISGKPIWSADGTKLLISQFDETHKHINVLMVDLNQGLTYKIAQDVEPIGWLRQAP